MNGKPYDPSRTDFQVKRGTTEIWMIKNDDADLGRRTRSTCTSNSSGCSTATADRRRRRTRAARTRIFLAPGETVRVQATFSDFLGTYVYHCHFLEHSTMGMMAQMTIVP